MMRDNTMRNAYKMMGLVMIALMFFGCAKESKQEQDVAVTDDTRSMLFENQYAEVIKVVLEKGESQEAHDGKDRLIYSLSDYSIEWMEQGEDLGTKEWSKGMVHYHPSGIHSAANNGDTTAEWLVFARTEEQLPECGDNTLENDVNTVAPDYAEVLFENDLFRMTKVSLPAGEMIPTHSGINRIIYSLTDYTLQYESDKEGVSEKEFSEGDVHWHEACMHSLENKGESDAIFLVVSYK
jgi:hypothetical protein